VLPGADRPLPAPAEAGLALFAERAAEPVTPGVEPVAAAGAAPSSAMIASEDVPLANRPAYMECSDSNALLYIGVVE